MSSMLHQLTSEASARCGMKLIAAFFYELHQKIVQLFALLFVFNCHFHTTGVH